MEIDILQNPYNGLLLRQATQKRRAGLIDPLGAFFPLRNGYPNFLTHCPPSGLNRLGQRRYDWLSRIAGWSERLFETILWGQERREEWLRGLRIAPGDRVLEVSIGTGQNIRRLPAHAHYFGIDISGGMLDRCAQNARHWGREIKLCQGNAEYLPYRDDSFDCVFHIGGINFFNDRRRAIEEMLRVAKPGACIILMDKTAKAVRAQYRRSPFLSAYLREAEVDRSRLYAPAQFVPDYVRDVELKLLDDGSMYRLQFFKPLRAPQEVYLLPNL